MYAVNRGEAAL